MSKNTFLWFTFVIILLSLTSCVPPPTPTPLVQSIANISPEATPENEQGLNFLVSSDVPVKIKRRTWSKSDYQPAAFGTIIQRGDLILPLSSGTATILCADLTVHTIDQESGSPCQVNKPELDWDGARIINPMAAPTGFPYILHPRRTLIRDERPWLRWHDTGADSYTVAVIQNGQSIWQQIGVTGTELRYPDEAPPLESGVDYLLEVIDEDTGSSSAQDPLKGLGFQLLTSERTTLINELQAEIEDLPLDISGQLFALAIYYSGQGLHGEALALLDEVKESHNLAGVQLWRGHILLATRLYPEAQTAYTAALDLAETMDDVEGQALARVGLWRTTGDENHYAIAINLYQQLGDEQTIIDLQEDHR